MFFNFRNRVDKKWYISNYEDVRLSGLDSKHHYNRYGKEEERLPNPFSEIRSTIFRSLFLFLSALNIRLNEYTYYSESKFISLINLFFRKEYKFLENINVFSTKFYLTSWVGGGVSDALEFYVRHDLKKYETLIVLRSLKNISIQSTPIFQVEVYTRGVESPSIYTCPFPSILIAKLFTNSHNIAQIDIHHVFGFEKFLDFILDNFETQLNFYVHDYYLFSDNWSFFNVSILPRGFKTSYFQSQENSVWSYSSRKNFLSKCNSIIATSYHTFKLLNNERDFPVKKLEFRYIPEEANLELFEFNYYYAGRRENKKIKVLILGNLGIYKGLTVLNDIVDELESENFDFSFFHFGCVSEGVLNNKIISYGWMSKKDRQVGIEQVGADLAILPSQSPETYSMILSELIRLKIPIVASKIGALTERLFDRNNAHLVSNYMAPKSWAKEIIAFYESNFLDDRLNSDFNTEEIELIFEKRLRGQ